MKKIFTSLMFVMLSVLTASAAWDGTVTTSLDGQTVTGISDFDNLTLTFPGATTIEILGEEDCQYLALQNEDGSELYGIWGPTMGSEYTIDGNTITLAGFMTIEGSTIAIPAGTTKLYIEDYGTLAIDGVEKYLETMEFDANIAAAAEPFTLTASNYRIEGANGGRQEASENGLSTGFQIVAEPALTKGTGVPTLTFNGEDQGIADVLGYGYPGAGGSITFNAAPASKDGFFTGAGEYTLIIPEGTFVDENNTPNAAFSTTWVIIQGEAGSFAITGATNAGNEPGAEVEALSYMFEITAANAIKSLHEGNITLTDANDQPVGGYANVFGYEGEEGATSVYARFMFDTEDHMLHTAGTYTLNVPAGMFADAEGNLSEAYTASWTVKASDSQTINLAEPVVSTVVDNSWGTNDTYYTATFKFAKPEGAKYAYSEGLHMELNGENTGVPFQFGQYGMIELPEGDEVTLVYKDNMIAATEDASYEGDIRPAGSYVASTQIAFLDADQLELGVTAEYTGSIVLPALTPEGPKATITLVNGENSSELYEGAPVAEATALVLSFEKAYKNVTCIVDKLVWNEPDPEWGDTEGYWGEESVDMDGVVKNADGTWTATFSKQPQNFVSGLKYQIKVRAWEGEMFDDEWNLLPCDETILVVNGVGAEDALELVMDFADVQILGEKDEDGLLDAASFKGATISFPWSNMDEYFAEYDPTEMGIGSSSVVLRVTDAYLYKMDMDTFETDVENPVAHVTTVEQGEDYESVTIFQNNVTLEPNTLYVLSIPTRGIQLYDQAVAMMISEDDAVIWTNAGEWDDIRAEFRTADASDGISNVEASASDNVMYNLAGQRVNNAKGIVIMNGKKVVLK